MAMEHRRHMLIMSFAFNFCLRLHIASTSTPTDWWAGLSFRSLDIEPCDDHRNERHSFIRSMPDHFSGNAEHADITGSLKNPRSVTPLGVRRQLKQPDFL
jgi:hypothetical protein